MKTIYSIISVATQAQFGEQLGIGLLCINDEKVQFHYSEEKLQIVGKLLSPGAKRLATATIKSIQKAVHQTIEEHPFSVANTHLLSEEYISYLSRYTNNLIQFSQPATLDLVLDDNVFQHLFHKFIYSAEVFNAILKPDRPIQVFRQRFYRDVANYTNTHFKVTQSYLPNLLVPVTVDMFGKNDVYVSGQAIDFDQSVQALENGLTKYMNIALSSAIEERHATCYVIGVEPENGTRQHEIWQQVRNNSRLQYVPTDETERIVSYLREHDVKPVIPV